MLSRGLQKSLDKIPLEHQLQLFCFNRTADLFSLLVAVILTVIFYLKILGMSCWQITKTDREADRQTIEMVLGLLMGAEKRWNITESFL